MKTNVAKELPWAYSSKCQYPHMVPGVCNQDQIVSHIVKSMAANLCEWSSVLIHLRAICSVYLRHKHLNTASLTCTNIMIYKQGEITQRWFSLYTCTYQHYKAIWLMWSHSQIWLTYWYLMELMMMKTRGPRQFPDSENAII